MIRSLGDRIFQPWSVQGWPLPTEPIDEREHGGDVLVEVAGVLPLRSRQLRGDHSATFRSQRRNEASQVLRVFVHVANQQNVFVGCLLGPMLDLTQLSNYLSNSWQFSIWGPQPLVGWFSSAPKPNFATKYSLESS